VTPGEFAFRVTDHPFVLGLMKELGNSELYSSVLSQLTDSLILHLGRFSFRVSDLEFFASHFDEMTLPLFELISLPLVEAILSEGGLRLTSEDFLSDLISSRLDDNPEFCGLPDRPHFEYLSRSMITKLLGRRLALFEQSARSGMGTAVTGDHQDDGSFYGIISGLTSRYGGTVHKQGIATVSSSSTSSGSLSHVVDFSTEAGLSLESGR
jgi:hypothetical protein